MTRLSSISLLSLASVRRTTPSTDSAQQKQKSHDIASHVTGHVIRLHVVSHHMIII